MSEEKRKDRISLAAEIKRRRLEKGLTQAELASLAGLSFRQLQRYESASDQMTEEHMAKLNQELS